MRHLVVRRERGLTVVEVVAVVVIVAVLVAVLIPAIAASFPKRTTPHRSHQLRALHQGLVIFGQSNKFYYPGLDSMGQPLPNGEDTTGNSGDGTTVEARYWILLQGDFFTPEYAISPSETDASIVEYEGDFHFDEPPTPVRASNYSYTMLDIDAEGARVMEWKETANTQAVVMSDRNTGTAASPASIYDENKWLGSILWNDNHVGFEPEPYVETKYGNGELRERDNLFTDEGGDDAYLIYSGK